MSNNHDDLLSPWEPVPELVEENPPRAHVSVLAMIGRALSLGLAAAAVLLLLATLCALGIYVHYASMLPSADELRDRTTDFQSTKIYDRNGTLLYEIFDPLGGRRTVVPVSAMPSEVILATVATEDNTFFTNPGFSPAGIARALLYDLRHQELTQGGSTITQQLVKNVYLTGERTFSRKIKETILAGEITRRYTKEEILELYLNEVYYGNLAYGIGAASETYFAKPVSELSLDEAALLAGLLQSPAYYDPYTNPDAALSRRAVVLGLMLENGYITPAAYQSALDAPLALAPYGITMEAPHWVVNVRAQLETTYGTEQLYKGGMQVYTTLDLGLQHMAESVTREKIVGLREQNATNAALVAVDPDSGDVLAMLGSADFYSEAIAGQVNVATQPRQPGSTMKTLTYLAALERGWTAGTMLMDVPQSFPDGANPPYEPGNYDDEFWGPLSMRVALASSRNVPAVSTLYQIGLPALLEVSRRLGIESLNRPDYGLSLTLGGGEVTPLELTAAYATLANGGSKVTPRTILRIEDALGRVLYAADESVEMPRVVDARHAYILSDILADDDARARAFGANSPLRLSFPAAVKTGTTNDFRDSWTVGYTPDLAVGVWVGNSDNTPMDRVTGAHGAGLIWHDVMERALGNAERRGFVRPSGIIELDVCPVSGQLHTEHCPDAVTELYLEENQPGTCPVHRMVRLCTVSGELAGEYCPDEYVREELFVDLGPENDEWLRAQGTPPPPRAACSVHSSEFVARLDAVAGPAQGIIYLTGSAQAPSLESYVLEYAAGDASASAGWRQIGPLVTSPVSLGTLGTWDTRVVPNGRYQIRLTVTDRHGAAREATVEVQVRNEEPTVEPTMTPSPLAGRTTATLAPEPWVTRTRRIKVLPTLTRRVTEGAQIWATDTPRATETTTPSRTPTATLTETAVPTPESTPTF